MKITRINKGKRIKLVTHDTDAYILELDEDEKFNGKDIALLENIIKVLRESKFIGKGSLRHTWLTRIASAMMTHFDIKPRIHLSSYLQRAPSGYYEELSEQHLLEPVVSAPTPSEEKVEPASGSIEINVRDARKRGGN